ncbi:hypothetical protein ACFX12_027223 [Malus domestica]
MVSAEDAVPVWKLGAEGSDETRDGVRGEVRREGDEEEVGFFKVFGREVAVLEARVEERLGWGVKGKVLFGL